MQSTICRVLAFCVFCSLALEEHLSDSQLVRVHIHQMPIWQHKPRWPCTMSAELLCMIDLEPNLAKLLRVCIANVQTQQLIPAETCAGQSCMITLQVQCHDH